jgi:hypothetical protein
MGIIGMLIKVFKGKRGAGKSFINYRQALALADTIDNTQQLPYNP